MGWKIYKLIYRAESPIHIGWHTLGYIKLTRYYITGRAMWGAITANLTRSIGNPGTESYKEIGEQVFPSYFYPVINSDTPMLPKYTKTGLEYGDYTKSKFEKLFINSYGQTAVTPDTNTAEDNSLHESEYISHVVNINGKRQPVFFVGYIFIDENSKYQGRKVDYGRMSKALSEIYVGGDRKYGWGRLKLVDSEQTNKMFNFDISKFPEINISSNKPLPAHLKVNDAIKLKGDIEPLVGREWGELEFTKEGVKEIHRGFGQKISKATICWMPGSILLEEITLRFSAYGLLSK